MKQIITLILYCIVNLTSYTFSQDTIYFEKRIDFDQAIQYGFKAYTEGADSSIYSEVESKFKAFDLGSPEFDCQYHFTFRTFLDSCGNILDCNTTQEFNNQKLKDFSNHVSKIVLNSKWVINNMVELTDSIYHITYFLFTIEISCDPSEIIFKTGTKRFIDHSLVYVFKDKSRVIYFDGFKKNCSQ